MLKKASYLLLVILAVCLYIFTLKGSYGNPTPGEIKNGLDQNTKSLELSPERGRFALVMSLVHDHSFALSRTLANAVYPDVGDYNGRFYTYFVPGISLFTVPLYLLGYPYQLSLVFSFFLPAIFAVLNAVFIYQICRQVFKQPAWAGLFSALVFCFGSTSWSYAVTLYQHQTTTFFLLSSFYAVWKFRQKGRYLWAFAFWVWASLGLALTLDYPNALLMLPIMIYFALSAVNVRKDNHSVNITWRSSVIFTSSIFLSLLGLHGLYNYTQFGNPWRVSGSLPGMKLEGTDSILESKEKNVVGFFREESFPNGLYVLTVSPDRGLFVYSPIFVVGFLGLFIYLKRQAGWETSTLTASVLVLFFLYCSWGDPWGGWTFGPRYLIPAMGMLSIFVSGFLVETRKLAFKLLTFGLFVYSSAIALLGVLTTNAIPPKSEAVVLKTGYNFLRSWDFFRANKSSSFIYNSFFNHLALWQYALPIFLAVILLAVIFLFILPEFNKNDH